MMVCVLMKDCLFCFHRRCCIYIWGNWWYGSERQFNHISARVLLEQLALGKQVSLLHSRDAGGPLHHKRIWFDNHEHRRNPWARVVRFSTVDQQSTMGSYSLAQKTAAKINAQYFSIFPSQYCSILIPSVRARRRGGARLNSDVVDVWCRKRPLWLDGVQAQPRRPLSTASATTSLGTSHWCSLVVLGSGNGEKEVAHAWLPCPTIAPPCSRLRLPSSAAESSEGAVDLSPAWMWRPLPVLKLVEVSFLYCRVQRWRHRSLPSLDVKATTSFEAGWGAPGTIYFLSSDGHCRWGNKVRLYRKQLTNLRHLIATRMTFATQRMYISVSFAK